eukprot:Skav203702  [mRNA]  locus=scaffold259:330567:332897:+ [translate_table: standard]
MHVEAWHTRAALVLAAAVVLVYEHYFAAFLLLCLTAATLIPIGTGDAKLQTASAYPEVPADKAGAKGEAEPEPSPEPVDLDSKQEQSWTDSVKLADTGVAMPAAQVARAWLQMARSKEIISSHVGPAKSRPRPIRAGSSSDLCGSMTEGGEGGDTDPCSTPTGRANTLLVEMQRERGEPWGFQWRPGTRRWILDSVDPNSLAGAWNEHQAEQGLRLLVPGSTLLEVNGSNQKVVVRHELDKALRIRLTFLLPDEALIESLDPQSLECRTRIKNSFLEVTAADSHDERRNFSDPGPMRAAKSVSSAPEGCGGCGPVDRVDSTAGYVTESEAVSDLIGSTALIVAAESPHNGKLCQIEAFDPEVRRYVVRVCADEGPVSAKLRLENLMLQPSQPIFPPPIASFHGFQASLPNPEAFLNPYGPWSWPEPCPTFQSPDAMLMQHFPPGWGPIGDPAWPPCGQFGMPPMLGADIPTEGSQMMPCMPSMAPSMPSMPPSMPTLPPLSTTPVTNVPFPFDGLGTLPSDRPLVVTHQDLERQLLTQHGPDNKLGPDLIAGEHGELPGFEAFEAQLPQLHSLDPEGLEPPPDPKKKRRRRRRGKRKGQKEKGGDGMEEKDGENGDGGDENADDSSEDGMDAHAAMQEDGTAEPINLGKEDEGAISHEQPWRPQLPRQPEDIQNGPQNAQKEDTASLNTGGRAADWRPSLPRSLVTVTPKVTRAGDQTEILQPEPVAKMTSWQPSLHRAPVQKPDFGANPKGSGNQLAIACPHLLMKVPQCSVVRH